MRVSHNTKAVSRAGLTETTGMILLTLVLLLLLSGTALSQESSSARSVAMGSSFTVLAQGVDAVKFNPANLGIKAYRENGVELVGVGANVANNAFTLNDYNSYTGAFLTDADKEDILDKIPSEGLQLTAEAEASALTVARGPFAFAIQGFGVADINLSKDVMELVLQGNTFADTIDMTGSYSEAVAIGAASLSYGTSIYTSGTRELAVGVTAKYLYGIAIERVTEMEGMVATWATGLEGSGRLVAQTATGGNGYALDLGATLKLNGRYAVGARIKNVISSMTWTDGTEEHGYNFSFDTMTVDNMEDDHVVSDDYTREIGSFETDLPSVLNVGMAKTSGSLLWAIDWEQGFRRAYGTSSKPRISAGLEWAPVKALPLRAGYCTGGNKPTAFSFGSGFHMPVFYIDYAVVTGATLTGNSSKGLNFAVSTGLHF